MDRFASRFKSFRGTKEETTPILDESTLEEGLPEPSTSYSNENNEQSTSKSGQQKAITKPVNCFLDGKTKIDFVLVYEEEIKKKKVVTRTLTKEEVEEKKKKYNLAEQCRKWRTKFMKNLRRQGILIEEATTATEGKVIHYYKLNCPWDLLTHYAEELNIRAPLQLRQYKSHQGSAIMLSKLRLPNYMKLEVPNKPDLFFTCAFRKSKQTNFLGINDPDTYFSTTERTRIMYEVLQTTVFGKKRSAEIGIDRLVNEEVFEAAFPLHDGPFKTSEPIDKIDPATLNKRQVLYEYWARWGRWYKYQPLDHIRDYFGEKIGIYFAWLGFYTAWLLPVAVIGLIVFLAGLIMMHSHTESLEICSSGNKFMMCPLCTVCKEYALSSTCLMSKLAFLFDNTGTVVFATLMSFWAVFFLEFWKRKSANLAHHWETIGFEEEEEKPRPDYCARAPTLEVNPITGVLEPHFPPKQRIRRMFTAFAILCIMLAVVVIFVVSVILYKLIISVIMYRSRNKLLHGEYSILTTSSGAAINLILIMLMSNVYTAVAEWLTKWEMHRTQTEYDNALTLKVFVFQFVNYYSSIYYIAFFKGKLVGYPGHYGTMFGIRNESCTSGGCLLDLAQQLFIIMVGKQAINNVQELVIPKIKQWWQQRKIKKGAAEKGKDPWEIDYHKLVEFPGLFDEYLEMVLQFGFITIFVAAFPLAPFFALLNNWIEIRLDASKLVCEMRRPVANRAENIGIWYEILDALVQIAVITNAFLIAFTSEFIPRLLYEYVEGHGTLHGYVNFTLATAPPEAGLGQCRYAEYRDSEGHHTLYYYLLMACKLAFVIVFEHVVFFLGRMIDWSVPDVPESLQMKIKREQYLAKQALADNKDTSMEVMKLYHRSASQDVFYNDDYEDITRTLGGQFNKFKQRLQQLAPIPEACADNEQQAEPDMIFHPAEPTFEEESETVQSEASGATRLEQTTNTSAPPAVGQSSQSSAAAEDVRDLQDTPKIPMKRTIRRKAPGRLSKRSPRSSPTVTPAQSPHASDAGSEGELLEVKPSRRQLTAIPPHLQTSPDTSSADEDQSDLPKSRRRHLAARSKRTPKE